MKIKLFYSINKIFLINQIEKITKFSNINTLYILPPHMEQLWVDKYRPKTLDDLSYHLDLTKVLSQLA